MADMRVFYVSASISYAQRGLVKTFNSREFQFQLLTYILRKMKGAEQDYKELNARCVKINSYARGPILYLTRLKKVARKFMDNIDFNSDDILHGNMLFCDGIICRRISRKKGAKYVVSVRNTDINLAFLWKLPWIRRAGCNVLLDAERVIFLNETYRNQLLKKLPEKIRRNVYKKSRMVPNGIDEFWNINRYLMKRDLCDNIRILTIGRVEKNKNQVMVANAIRRINDTRSIKLSYVVVGDVIDKEMRIELENFDFVSIKHHMEKEDLIQEYRHADIFVLASHTETFGLVYAEALTQGLPIIYTQGQGFDKQFPDGEVGYPVNSDDVQNIQDTILKVIDNYNEINERIIKMENRFSWEYVVDRFLECYKN